MSFGFRCLLLSALVAMAPACSSRRSSAEEKLDAVGVDELRREAALLYKNVFASTAPSFVTVKPKDWPASFRAFAPKHVGAYRDGFSLALETDDAAEAGLYIVPQHMEVSPNPGRNAKFERIRDGIYWYSFPG